MNRNLHSGVRNTKMLATSQHFRNKVWFNFLAHRFNSYLKNKIARFSSVDLKYERKIRAGARNQQTFWLDKWANLDSSNVFIQHRVA